MQKSYAVVATIQAVLHYLAIAGIVLGVIAFLFGNSSRAWELIIGGASLFVIKYIVGAIFLLVVKVIGKN